MRELLGSLSSGFHSKKIINSYQPDKSGLHILVFDGFTLADTVGDVEMDEFTRQIDSCCQAIDHLH